MSTQQVGVYGLCNPETNELRLIGEKQQAEAGVRSVVIGRFANTAAYFDHVEMEQHGHYIVTKIVTREGEKQIIRSRPRR